MQGNSIRIVHLLVKCGSGMNQGGSWLADRSKNLTIEFDMYSKVLVDPSRLYEACLARCRDVF